MKLPLLAAAACGVAILSCLTAGGSQNTESRRGPRPADIGSVVHIMSDAGVKSYKQIRSVTAFHGPGRIAYKVTAQDSPTLIKRIYRGLDSARVGNVMWWPRWCGPMV